MSRGRLVTVWTSQDCHGLRRYIVDGEGRLISFASYLSGILETEQEREERQRRYARDASNRRWARRAKSHKRNGQAPPPYQ